MTPELIARDDEFPEVKIPSKIGYAIQQTDLDDENAILGGIDPYWRLKVREVRNSSEMRLREFLSWVRDTYNPERIYYPFTGWHISPREIFGERKVVHLSSDFCDPHLADIEKGDRIRGDAESQPFQDNSFDAAFFHGVSLGRKEISTFFFDTRRIVKDGGIIIIDDTPPGSILKHCKRNLVKLEVPSEFPKDYHLFSNVDLPKKPRFSFLRRNI